ncbi:MAG TPA: CRTAC1 family protein, partial [bacterium]|nr:CRTAC1 family protein [bacterium]
MSNSGTALAAAAVVALIPAAAIALPTFTNVTNTLGLGDSGHRHFGITIVDINGDGFVDLYYANGLQDPFVVPIPTTGTCPNTPISIPAENKNTLYMNNGDGTFTGDVAPSVGLDDDWNAMRNVFGDYDNDGDRDLISHNFFKSPLYRCDSWPSPLSYTDVSSASEMSLCLLNGTGASWVDLDRDGDLDLYGCEYDLNRLAADHLTAMYLNDGDGTFTNVTVEAGVNLADNGMGIAFCDYDNDGDEDFFMTNSHEVPTRLYRHDGLDSQTGIPVFVDVAVEAGVAVQDTIHRGVGIGWGDYNNDGRFDMIFTRDGDSRLWRNDGPNGSNVWTFADMSTSNGMNTKFTYNSYGMWGGNFIDLDNDGWLDVILCNRGQGGQPNHVYMNNRDGTWTESAAALNLSNPGYQQMGVVGADYDNDGDLDLFLASHQFGQQNLVYRNDTTPKNNWIQFRLTGTVSNRDAVGARIHVTAELETGRTETQLRDVIAGTGFFSDFPRIQTFGLGTASQVDEVVIRWPNGYVQTLGPLAVNQRYDITESIPVDAPSLPPPAAADLVLEAARPNPFGAATTIRFAVPARGRVRVEVFSVDGRRLASLV